MARKAEAIVPYAEKKDSRSCWVAMTSSSRFLMKRLHGSYGVLGGIVSISVAGSLAGLTVFEDDSGEASGMGGRAE